MNLLDRQADRLPPPDSATPAELAGSAGVVHWNLLNYSTTAILLPTWPALQFAEALSPPLVAPNSPPSVVETALALCELGLNVSLQPFAEKGGYPWKGCATEPLPVEELTDLINYHFTIYGRDPNLCVIAGRRSGNLLIIDCETHEAFATWRQRLLDEGYSRYTVRTARGGHLYLRCLDGEVRNLPGASIQEGPCAGQYEIRGNTCYVLAPSAVHPNGDVYTVVNSEDIPTLTLAQLQALGLPIRLDSRCGKPHLQGRNAEPADGYPLSHKTRLFLEGTTPHGSRNNELFAAACDMNGCGMTLVEVREQLLPAALACGLEPDEATRTINSAFGSPRVGAREYYGGQPGRELGTLQRAAQWIQQRKWPGRIGQSQRALALAFVERAHTATDGVFRASVRELGELARLNKNTVCKRIPALVDLGLVISVGQDQHSDARLWKLGHVVQLMPMEAAPQDGEQRDGRGHKSYTTNPGSNLVYDLCPHPEHTDAAERGALGKTALGVWRGMLAYGRPFPTQSSIALALGLSPHQVKRALAKLGELAPTEEPLVERTPQGWIAYARDDAWLELHIAQPSGTAGQGQRRHERHRQERIQRAVAKLRRAIRHHPRQLGYDLED